MGRDASRHSHLYRHTKTINDHYQENHIVHIWGSNKFVKADFCLCKLRVTTDMVIWHIACQNLQKKQERGASRHSHIKWVGFRIFRYILIDLFGPRGPKHMEEKSEGGDASRHGHLSLRHKMGRVKDFQIHPNWWAQTYGGKQWGGGMLADTATYHLDIKWVG